jgi:hypothetical protein
MAYDIMLAPLKYIRDGWGGKERKEKGEREGIIG